MVHTPLEISGRSEDSRNQVLVDSGRINLLFGGGSGRLEVSVPVPPREPEPHSTKEDGGSEDTPRMRGRGRECGSGGTRSNSGVQIRILGKIGTLRYVGA